MLKIYHKRQLFESKSSLITIQFYGWNWCYKFEIKDGIRYYDYQQAHTEDENIFRFIEIEETLNL